MTDIKMPIISLIIFDSVSTKEIDIKNKKIYINYIKGLDNED